MASSSTWADRGAAPGVDLRVMGRAASGLATVSSLVWPWTSTGTGSTLPAHRLADLAIAGHASAFVSPPLGWSWYAMALAGALLCVAAPFSGSVAVWTRSTLVALAWAALLVVTVGLGALPGRLGTGAIVAIIAAIGGSILVVTDHTKGAR